MTDDSHRSDQRTEQERMERFYVEQLGKRGLPIVWDRDQRTGDYHSESARDAWAAWQSAARLAEAARCAAATVPRPVAWRYLIDSPFELRPRWVYCEREPSADANPERVYTLSRLQATAQTLTEKPTAEAAADCDHVVNQVCKVGLEDDAGAGVLPFSDGWQR
jgi:hypothetical protein